MNSLMSDVVETSSSYLYPCTIEYSLICAGKYTPNGLKQAAKNKNKIYLKAISLVPNSNYI